MNIFSPRGPSKFHSFFLLQDSDEDEDDDQDGTEEDFLPSGGQVRFKIRRPEYFHYFVFEFTILVLVPGTWYYVPSFGDEPILVDYPEPGRCLLVGEQRLPQLGHGHPA